MKLNSPQFFIFFAFSLIFGSLLSSSVFADEPVFSEVALTEAEKSYLIQNCDTLKTGLKRLAVSDSKTRTYFGGIYETISSKYIIPLNLRLVKNNYSFPELTSLQSSVASSRAKFSSDFIAYSKSLEDLIATDCKTSPETFYEKLIKTRSARSLVKSDLESLNELLKSHYSLVKNLKGSFNG